MTMQPFECESCGREMETNKEYCTPCEEYIHGEPPLVDTWQDGDYPYTHEREYEEPNPYSGTYSEE